MAVIAETILQRAILNGFRAIRKDPRVINLLFKNLPSAQQEDIKSFILDNEIDFSINYPRSDIKVPAIILLMKNETEAQTFLGDVMGTSGRYDTPDADSSDGSTLGGNAGSVSPMGGLPAAVLTGLNVLQTVNSGTGIIFTTASQNIINGVVPDLANGLFKLYVTSGTGAGKVYIINQISPAELDIVGTFDPQLDSTSIVDIRHAEAPEAAYGEPQRVYNANSNSLIRLGANFDVQYQLEVLGGSQEQVIYLYTVLKTVLLSQRSFLEAQGIMALKISGSDFAPRSEFLPDEIFHRCMILQFVYPFDFLQELETVKYLEISLNVNPDPSAADIPGDDYILARLSF